ncbi:hypothetical protein BU15DRAFT_74399 [Melanogaster broomeanus]|nr:hypothetical protein BU15DRAFT_74399 [Melanogaster broomeanus]
MLDDTSPAHLAIWRPIVPKAMNSYVPAVVMNTCRQEAHALPPSLARSPLPPPHEAQPVNFPAPTPPLPSSPVPIPIPRSSNGSEEKRWSASLWRFSFPRSSSPPRATPPSDEEQRGRRGSFTDAFPFHSFFSLSPASSWRRSPSPPASEPPSVLTPTPPTQVGPMTIGTQEQCRQAARPRTKRWFPSKLFTTAGVS